jgi:virginiamycin B lyase
LSGGINEFAVPTAGSWPYLIATGGDGNLWFAEDHGNKIASMSSAGVVSVELQVPTANSQPAGVAVGADGNVWFTEFNADKIGRVNSDNSITEFPLPGPGRGPLAIVSGPDGNLWFTEYLLNADRVGRITTNGVVTEFTVPTAGSQPCYITAGPDGNVWFTEQSKNKIGRVTPDGVVTEFGLPNANSYPTGITAGQDGRLWFTEEASGANKLGRISTAGAVTEIPIPTDNSGANAITTGPDGKLWFTESNANKVGSYEPLTGSFAEFGALTANSQPEGIAAGPDGNVWFTELGAGKIGQVVLDRPLTATGNAITAATGEPFTAVVASFHDADPSPGPSSAYLALVNWGDGPLTSVGDVSAIGGGNFYVRGSHTYAAQGSYAVSVLIFDNDTSHDIGGSSTTADGTADVGFSFSDNFEESALDPFWSTDIHSGSITFPSTAQAHSGSQSVQFNSTNSSEEKNIALFHHFDVPIYGRVSVWVYDTGAGEPSSNYIQLNVANTQLNQVAYVSTWDYDPDPMYGSTYIFGAPGVSTGFTTVPRTKDWHEWVIDNTPTSLQVTIDGVSVYTASAGMQFDRVALQMFGPYWRPAWVAYFDDFEVTQSGGGGGGGGPLIQGSSGPRFSLPATGSLPPLPVPGPAAVRALAPRPSPEGASATTGNEVSFLGDRLAPDAFSPLLLWQGPILPLLPGDRAEPSFGGLSGARRLYPEDLLFATVREPAEPLDLNGYALLSTEADFLEQA